MEASVYGEGRHSQEGGGTHKQSELMLLYSFVSADARYCC